jgi:hypothetical protein
VEYRTADRASEFSPSYMQLTLQRAELRTSPFGAERPIYGSYRTANLQTLHFKYVLIQQKSVLNIFNVLHNLRSIVFKMPFIS